MARAIHMSDPLSRYVDRVMTRLRRRIPAALRDWDEDAIHDVRVATRRLRAALELLGPLVPARRISSLRKTARRLRRRLGSLRDFDVMMQSLDTLSRRAKLAPAAKWMSDRLRDARDASRRKVQKKGSANDFLDRLDAWKPLREQLIEHRAAIEPMMLASLRLQWDAFAAKADARSAGLFEAHDAIPNPHELRLAGKMLRYTFEMCGEAGQPLPPMVSRTFRRMQTALGDWHDCVVLEERAMRLALDEALALRDPAMQARLLELIRFVLRRGDRALRRFAALWHDNGNALADVVDAIAVSGPRTDRDPGRSVEMPRLAPPPPDASSAA